MRPVFACLLLTAVVAPGYARDDEDPEWKEFSPRGGGFAVRLPGKPSEFQLKDAVVAGTKLKQKGYALRRPDAVGGFLVAYRDIPFGLADGDKDTFLKKVQENEVQDANGGELVASKKFNLNGHPGRDYTIKMETDNGVFYLRGRMALVDDRLYVLAVIGDAAFVKGDEAKKFFDSFELLD